MPQDEFQRITNKFTEKKHLITKPKIIILNNNNDADNDISKSHSVDINEYCLTYSNDTFIVYKNILYCK